MEVNLPDTESVHISVKVEAPATIKHNMQLVKKDITDSNKLCISNSHMDKDLPTMGEKVIY